MTSPARSLAGPSPDRGWPGRRGRSAARQPPRTWTAHPQLIARLLTESVATVYVRCEASIAPQAGQRRPLTASAGQRSGQQPRQSAVLPPGHPVPARSGWPRARAARRGGLAGTGAVSPGTPAGDGSPRGQGQPAHTSYSHRHSISHSDISPPAYGSRAGTNLVRLAQPKTTARATGGATRRRPAPFGQPQVVPAGPTSPAGRSAARRRTGQVGGQVGELPRCRYPVVEYKSCYDISLSSTGCPGDQPRLRLRAPAAALTPRWR